MGRALTIDELAAESGIPSRTIRFYQAHGAIPPPEKRGRVAYYGTEHVDRLALVLELQERGLHLKAIAKLLARADSGEVRVADWLGLGDRLGAPWPDADAPDAADRLRSAGVPAELAEDLAEALSVHGNAAAHDVVRKLTRAARRRSIDLADAVEALRSVAADSMRAVFAREMERELGSLVKSGKAIRTKARAEMRRPKKSRRE